MAIDIRILGSGDGDVLARVAPDVFDHPIDVRWSSEFLTDPRHHLAVAFEGETVVGMASGVHYVHPDKPPELWVNEVGVASTHRRLGIGQQLLKMLLVHGRKLGCVEAWVLTEQSNTAARGLYASVRGQEAAESPIYITFPLSE